MARLDSEHVRETVAPGDTLAHRLRGAALDPFETRVILGQVGHALAAAHAAHVVHGRLDATCVHVRSTLDEERVRVVVSGFGAPPHEVAGVAGKRPYRAIDAAADLRAFAELALAVVGAAEDAFARERLPQVVAWRARCIGASTSFRGVGEAVAALSAILATGSAPRASSCTSTATRGPRGFEWGAPRRDHALSLAPFLARLAAVGRARAIPITTLAFVAAIAWAFASVRGAPVRGEPWAPSPAALAASLPERTLTSAADGIARPPSRDLDTCPDRYQGKPLLAFAERNHWCARAALLPELDAGTLGRDELRALKLTCASLADLGCELRAMDALSKLP